MKATNIIYWICTILIVLLMLFSAFGTFFMYSAQGDAMMKQMELPAYLMKFLAVGKVLGAIAILVPGFPRLKEWAYAGYFFDLTGAAASCAWVGGYGAYGFHVIAPLVLSGITVASWALRPASRTLY